MKKIFTKRLSLPVPTDGFFQRKKTTRQLSLPVISHIPAPRSVCLKFVLSFLIVLATNSLRAQQIRFDQLSIAEGLSSNSVYTAFQDSNGILWFATLDGLNRYDGYQITTFKHDHLKSGSLPNNRITLIYQDLNHHLWLYDEFTSTLIKYLPIQKVFKAYYLEKVANIELEICSIYEDSQGTLFIHSRLGYLLRYNKTTDTFELQSNSKPFPDLPDNQNLLNALGQYLAETKSMFNTETLGIRKIFKDSNNRYWIATRYNGLYTALSVKNKFHFTNHLHTTDEMQRINSEDIHDVYEDRSQVIWICTKNSGVYRYSLHKYKFNLIQSIETSAGTLELGTLRAIVQDSSKAIWVGTNDNGLIRIDPSGRTGKNYIPETKSGASVGHRFIRSLWIGNDHTLWVGHYNGFSIYHPKTDNFTSYYPEVKTGEEIRVYDIKSDKQNGVWMAAWDLILNYNYITNEYQTISRKTANVSGFNTENIRDLELTEEGDLWIAVGEKGMSIYNSTQKKFTTVNYSPSLPHGLPTDNIFDIYKDSRNILWLSTADGLCEFDPLRLTCKTYSVNDGLPANLIYGLLEDQDGNLWFSSTRGIGKFDRKNKTFKNYDVDDGLQSNEFSENAFYKNKEGIMFFGGINGLNFIDPNHIPENLHPPQVAITSIKVIDKTMSEIDLFDAEAIKERLLQQQEIRFTPEQHSVSFEFVGLHYVNPQKNKYAYMLEGFDQDWTYRESNIRFANYTNLEHGTYFFKVKASNSDGIWSKPIQLKIIIEKPFYATVWFILFCSILLITVGVSAYRWRIAKLKKQQSIKSIQLETELNFLKSQVNPHFLFNTLNNIYALCQVNSKNAAPMVGKVSEMMRYMIYDCTTDLVSLQKEVDYLKNYIDLNQLKSNRKLNASLHVEGNVNGLKIPPLLLINFLENSFKHGDISTVGHGFIDAQLSIYANEIRFMVRNSFLEKTNTQSQKGIGLENVKHRLDLLYPNMYTLKIEKSEGIFEVELRVKLIKLAS